MLPKAECYAPVQFGSITINCAVMPDGECLITKTGFMSALGKASPSAKDKYPIGNLPPFLAINALKPYITNELTQSGLPIDFLLPGGHRAKGYKSDLFLKVADIYIKASLDNPNLPKTVKETANLCTAIMSSLAGVGLTAMIWQACGFHKLSNKDSLEKLLAKYLTEKEMEWVKQFPQDFYDEIYRLKNWPNPLVINHRYPIVGKITRDIVFSRIAPKLLERLDEKNPKNENGKRKHCHHQYLTEDIGKRELQSHLYAIRGLMRGSNTWEEFYETLNKFYPEKTMKNLIT